jgi:hypothetical protein
VTLCQKKEKMIHKVKAGDILKEKERRVILKVNIQMKEIEILKDIEKDKT